jgi:hypothetical protein
VPWAAARLTRLALLFVLGLLCPSTVWARQDAPATVTPFFLDTTRLESWSFFEPQPAGGDPSYSLAGNRATMGVRVTSRRLDVEGSFQYAQLIGLPRLAIGPGPLGPGPLYFEAARNPRAYQLYFKSLSVRLKGAARRWSLEVGRMPYSSNPESPRLSGRLIGNAEWTMSERAFDGARLDYATPLWRAHASWLMPTQGAYEESANPTIGKVQLATLSFSSGPVSIFGHRYRDTRPIPVRPDNSFHVPSAVDVSVGTVGASYVREYAVGSGRLDAVLWGATQFGSWYGRLHHAASAVAEVGYRWPRATWQPAVRTGFVYASGDDHPFDRAHGTFFPMLPTTRPDVLAGTYAQMNLRDLSVAADLQPHGRIHVSAEVHRLSLANAEDHWYSGTGATAFRGDYFGYSSRASYGATGLGTFVQGAAEAALTRRWTVKTSVGFVNGGEVVRRQFAGHRLTVFLLESRLTFD